MIRVGQGPWLDMGLKLFDMSSTLLTGMWKSHMDRDQQSPWTNCKNPTLTGTGEEGEELLSYSLRAYMFLHDLPCRDLNTQI